MSIYRRCTNCHRDNRQTKVKNVCSRCNSTLPVGKYQVKVRDPLTGRWKSKVCPSLTVARRVETKFKTQAIEGKLFDINHTAARISFGKYLEWATVNKRSWRDDKSRWLNHVAEYDYHTTRGIQSIVDRCSLTLAPATCKQVLTLINRVYNWHIQQGLYGKPNPCQGLSIPRFDNKVTNLLTQEQLSIFMKYLEEWDNQNAARVVQFAMYTGRRRGEILNLTWKDVDLEARTIICRNTKNSIDTAYPLSISSYQIMCRIRQEGITLDTVFLSPSGKPYHHTFPKAWDTLRRKLKREEVLDIMHYRFHDIRHQYASMLASSGKVDIYSLQRLLGHSDIKLTERYAHLSDSRLMNAVQVIESTVP